MRWKGPICKAAKLALAYHQSYAQAAVWRHMESKMAACGLTMPSAGTHAHLPDRWQCDLCQKVFGSTRALAMHASRERGYRKRVRFFANGNTCMVCGQLFHTRNRLCIRLEKTQMLRCRSKLLATYAIGNGSSSGR